VQAPAAAVPRAVAEESVYPTAQYLQSPVKDPAAEAIPVVRSEYPVAHIPRVVLFFNTQE